MVGDHIVLLKNLDYIRKKGVTTFPYEVNLQPVQPDGHKGGMSVNAVAQLANT